MSKPHLTFQQAINKHPEKCEYCNQIITDYDYYRMKRYGEPHCTQQEQGEKF